MKYNIQAIILFTMVLKIPVVAQTPSQNLNKYWDYRTEFFDKFIVDVDPNSLPSNYPTYGINIPAGLLKSTEVKWGDSEVKLGRYMAAMAGEYKLLQMANLDNSNPQEKLYRAMSAVNRLDSYAEPSFGCGVSGDPPCYTYTNINGFFIRDDVDQDFLDHWANLGKTDWIGKDVISDFTDPIPSKKEMSQDQVVALMLGHSLIRKYVDASATYEYFPCSYKTIKDYAKAQTYRSIKYMQTYIDDREWTWKEYGTSSYPGRWIPEFDPVIPPLFRQVWKIKNPCTGHTVDRGGAWIDVYPHMELFEDAGDWITDGRYSSLSYYSPNPLLPPFELEINPPIPDKINDHYFNDAMKLILATIADDAYASDLDKLFWNIRKCVDYHNSNIQGNPYDLKYFWQDHLPMLYVLLHDKNPENSKIFQYYYSHIEQLLNEAPVGGPECDVFPPTEYIWTRSSMFDSPMGYYISDGDNARLGEYNGLDYMVLFNLYHLVYQTKFNNPVSITSDFPTTYSYQSYDFEYGDENIDIGHEDNAAYYTIHSKDLITMNSAVGWNGKMGLCGNEVVLQAGFEVAYGGEFTAETNEKMELDFTPPAGNYKMATMNNSIQLSPSIEPNVNQNSEEADLETFIEESLHIYPNPANSELYIESPDEMAGISIYNSGGVLVYQSIAEGYHCMSFDVSEYNPGLYFIAITYPDGNAENRLIVIE